MLRNAEKESSRRYRVIGYREFELSYLGTEAENVKWFTRASKIFLDLEVGVEERFDGRKKQLRLVYSSVYNVLKALSEIKTSDVEVASKALEKLPAELK